MFVLRAPDERTISVLHEQMLNAVKPLELTITVVRQVAQLQEVSVSATAFKTTDEAPPFDQKYQLGRDAANAWCHVGHFKGYPELSWCSPQIKLWL